MRSPAVATVAKVMDEVGLIGRVSNTSTTQAKVRRLLTACRGSHLVLLPIEGRHMGDINTILSKYEDQRVDCADACLIRIAERE